MSNFLLHRKLLADKISQVWQIIILIQAHASARVRNTLTHSCIITYCTNLCDDFNVVTNDLLLRTLSMFVLVQTLTHILYNCHVSGLRVSVTRRTCLM